jgi:hypothetical protein
MARNYDDQGLIRRYLLNQLTAEEQERIEQRLLTENEVFEELEIAEDELIDDYLSEKLSPAARKTFEENFLGTRDRQQKVQFARSLSRFVRANEKFEKTSVLSTPYLRTTHNWALPVAAVVAGIVVSAGIFWFSHRHTPSPPALATFTLTISAPTRGEGPPANKVTVPLNTSVRLLLELPETAKRATRYRLELLTPTGQIQTLHTAAQDGKSVFIELPAGRLSPGLHALNVYVVNPDKTEQRIRGSYLFTVE